ncbi:hypothetical protein ACET3Z_024413 [Daucus carota]
MTIAGNVSGSLQITTTNPTSPGIFTEEDLYLKDTLAAYRKAADAARIQAAFREQSLRVKFPCFSSSLLKNPKAPHQLLRDGQVEESYSSQSISQSTQEWYQEAPEATQHLHPWHGPQVLEEPEVCQEAQQQG